MKIFATAALLAAALLAPAHAQQSFRLEAGEWRWVPFRVSQIPTDVDCRFRVLEGGPTVHVELLPDAEFGRFNHGRPHETLAVSPVSGAGAFRRTVDRGGSYAVLVVNQKKAGPVTVALELSTEIGPNGATSARELPKERRLAVILISFGIFFVTVTWSAMRLSRAISRRS